MVTIDTVGYISLAVFFVDVHFHGAVGGVDEAFVGTLQFEKQQEHFYKQAGDHKCRDEEIPVIKPAGNSEQHGKNIQPQQCNPDIKTDMQVTL